MSIGVVSAAMSRSIRVASLNLRAYPNPSGTQIRSLASLLSAHRPDVALLQECMRGWVPVIEETAGLVGVHSHLVPPETPKRAFPPDGCAIAVRSPVQIESSRRVDPALFKAERVHAEVEDELPSGFEDLPERLRYRYSARTLLAELTIDGRRFAAGSFHATPGTGKVGGRRVSEWKPFFHAGVALQLSKLEQPFVFAIDANEPRAETSDSVDFHWKEGRPGAAKFAALLGRSPIHRARDVLRDSMAATWTPPMSDEYLSLTYTTRGGHGRRFDSIWATDEFGLLRATTHYEETLAAGGDHALILADLKF
jgi:hypothetical protein